MRKLLSGLLLIASAMYAGTYTYSTYSDNWEWWSNGHLFPSVPEGVDVDLSFGVIKADGTLDPRYPIDPNQPYNPVQGIPPTPPGCTGLAIGGWNDSITGGGLYTVMHSTNPKLVSSAAANIVAAAVKYKYKRIIIDYEDYSGLDLATVKKNFMAFIGQVVTGAHKNKISVAMAISPDPKHQNYYDLKALSSTVDAFQIMTYDYSRGATIVSANASIMQTKNFLSQIVKVIKDLSKIEVGVPFYGIQFEIAPNTPASTVHKQLNSGTLSSISQEVVSDDALLKALGGSWDEPGGDWIVLQDDEKIPNYYYYSQHYGHLVSAMNPAAMKDFAKMLKKSFPKVTCIFSWEAQNDMKGEMMRNVMSAFSSKSTNP